MNPRFTNFPEIHRWNPLPQLSLPFAYLFDTNRIYLVSWKGLAVKSQKLLFAYRVLEFSLVGALMMTAMTFLESARFEQKSADSEDKRFIARSFEKGSVGVDRGNRSQKALLHRFEVIKEADRHNI